MVWLPAFFKISYFLFERRKSYMQVLEQHEGELSGLSTNPQKTIYMQRRIKSDKMTCSLKSLGEQHRR